MTFKAIKDWLQHWLSPSPVFMTIVRKYTDANGSYIGELYLEHNGIGAQMIGVSLDTLGFAEHYYWLKDDTIRLDLRNDFLVHMPSNTIRVGAIEPNNNDEVRRRVAKLNMLDIRIRTMNRFIEAVMEKRKI